MKVNEPIEMTRGMNGQLLKHDLEKSVKFVILIVQIPWHSGCHSQSSLCHVWFEAFPPKRRQYTFEQLSTLIHVLQMIPNDAQIIKADTILHSKAMSI